MIMTYQGLSSQRVSTLPLELFFFFLDRIAFLCCQFVCLSFLCCVQVLLEAKNDFNQDRWNSTWKAAIGAYDPEILDRIEIHLSQPTNGTLTISNSNRDVPNLLQRCDDAKSTTVMEQ